MTECPVLACEMFLVRKKQASLNYLDCLRSELPLMLFDRKKEDYLKEVKLSSLSSNSGCDY